MDQNSGIERKGVYEGLKYLGLKGKEYMDQNIWDKGKEHMGDYNIRD